MTRSAHNLPSAEIESLGISRRLTLRSKERDIVSRLTTNNFDLLRLIFASTVVFFHIGVLTQEPSLAWLQQFVSGTFGVQGFFVVSGFLVTMSYDRSHNLLSYARKRARRIFPAYIVVVLGAAVTLVAISQLPSIQYFTHPGWSAYVFWNLLLANFMSPDLPGVFLDNYKHAVNGSLWTIKVEIGFYCMVPVVAYLCRRACKWHVMAILLIASLAWRLGFDLIGQMTGNGFWEKLAIQAPGQFAFFIAGAIAYERTRDGLSAPRFWMAVAGTIAYVLTSGMVHELVAPLAVGIIVYWASIAAPYVGRASRYGDFSYGIYLYHWPVIQTFVALGLFAASPTLATIATLATVLALAVCSWYLVERHFLSKQFSSYAPDVRN